MPTTSCFPLLLLVLLHRLAAGEPPPPPSQQIEPHASSLRTLCSSGGAEFVQLGACTSSFVKCGKSGKARLLRCFEGQVFANGKCRSPSKVAACQDERLLFMVEETRQLAELDGVCQQTGREAIDLLHFDCADQALLCDAQEGQPVVVSCPPGLFYSLTSGACERRCAKREDEDRAEPAAIRAWLLSRSCSRLKQRNGRKADDDHRLMRVHSERCRAFLVDCGSDLPTVFHCEADELFDERSKTCRPIDPEKDATCTPPRICSGHAFDFISHPPTPLSPSSSLSCSPSFVYCDALEPRTFECRDGFVFHQGKCVSAEKEAPHCVPCMVGARRTDDSSNATCASFEECVPSEKPPGARWKQQQCKERHAYFDVEQTCVRDAGCAKALDCSAGSHVRLSCGEALVCDEDGRLRPVSCTPPSRFDATSWRCDFSRPCQDEQAQSADSDDKTIRQVPNNDDDEDDELAPIEEGEKCDASRHLRAHPTNCRRFFECSPNSDRWTTRKCRALRDGGDFFDATQQRCVQDEHVCQSRTSSLQTCQSGEVSHFLVNSTVLCAIWGLGKVNSGGEGIDRAWTTSDFRFDS